MGEVKTRIRELKHTYVLDENNNVVNAALLREEDRVNHKYHIIGVDENGIVREDPVFPVIKTKKRKHFKQCKVGSTTTKDGRQIYHVKTTKEYHETVLHRLAKQLFENNMIKWVALPDSVTETPNGTRFTSKNPLGFYPLEIEIEKVVKLPNSDEYVKFDVFAHNPRNKTNLAIEINVTHRTEYAKVQKIKELGIDTIEIDLSDILYTGGIEEGTVESMIINTISNGSNTSWLVDTKSDRFNQALSGIVKINRLEKSNFKADGNWIVYKNNVSNILPKCPLILTWDGDTSSGNSDRYLTEDKCSRCPRYLGLTKDQSGAKVAMCNQSDFDSRHVIGKILNSII